MSKRRLLFCFVTTAPLVFHAACSSTNGDPIPNEVFDATAIDTGGNPRDPDSATEEDGGARDAAKDSAVKDAGNDAPVKDPVVVINELYVDRIIDGDGSEFVELRADPGTPVDDLKLRLVNTSGAVKVVSVGPAGAKVGASGLWVVGGSQTFRLNVQDRVDYNPPLNDWGLNYPGAVQLVRGTTLLDVVGFDSDPDGGTPTAPASPPTATVEGKTAFVPPNAGATAGTQRRSFGRRPTPAGGAPPADTNDNRADFCTMIASPGYPQKACE